MTLGISFGAIASSMTTDTPYPVNAVDFDGTNDYMLRGAGLTGAVDSNRGIFSAWVRIDAGNGTTRNIVNSANNRVAITANTSNLINFALRDGASTVAFDFKTVAALTASASWVHILASWDTNFGAGLKLSHLYINGVSDNVTATDNNQNVIDYTDTDWSIGSDTSGAGKWDGCMAEVYLNLGEYLDLSSSVNRAKFRKANGKPEDMGLTANLPTGTAPLIYLKGNAAGFGTNSGTGGNLTITGTLDTASTSPSD